MVKNFIIILLFISVLDSKGQRYPTELGINLRVCFSQDMVYFGDSLKVILSYKNNSEADIVFYPNAIIGINHYHPDAFISYDTPERIMYRLNNVCSNDEYVNLKPNEIFIKTYNIKADSNFFYEGENIVIVFYHLYNKPLIEKRRRTDKSKPILSLWSCPVKINISSKERSLKKALHKVIEKSKD